MSAHGGPNIVEDGLVLALDAANIKSFRGEPTTNLRTTEVSGQYAYFNYGSGQYTWHGIETSGEYAGWHKITATSTHTNRLIMGLNGITAQANTTYTATIEWISPNNSLSFECTGNQGFGIGIAVAGEPNRYYKTFTKNANNGGMHWYLRTADGSIGAISNGIIYYRNVQWEQKSYPTPFVDGTRGTTVATGGGWADRSGNSIHGELVNNPTYSSSNLGYLQFATNTAIIIPNNTALDTQTPTVEVWVKTNATNQNGFWFEKGTVNSQYSLFQGGTQIYWRQNYGASYNNLSISTATYMNTSNWYQVVGTYTSGTRRLYINGVLVNSDTRSGTISTNSGGMSIGAYGGYTGGRSYYYNGNLAICNIYNRALTASEVLQNYNATKGRFGL